jgi:leader peptidase (prepilin peptidase)/N-methyltransferase
MVELFVRAAVGFALGAVVGSFLATLILRWPVGRSILHGRSACDGCGRILQPHELVPLVRTLFQRGKCHGCHAAIDPLHWRIELACAAIGAAAATLSAWPNAIGWMLAGWLLLTLAVLDARHYWLPDILTLGLALLGLIISPRLTGVTPVDSVIGALAGYGIFTAVALMYRILRARDGLGMGDAKLLGALGAWSGWQSLPSLVLLASALALLWAAGQAAIRRQKPDAASMLPLGTFLCIAALPVLVMQQLGYFG